MHFYDNFLRINVFFSSDDSQSTLFFLFEVNGETFFLSLQHSHTLLLVIPFSKIHSAVQGYPETEKSMSRTLITNMRKYVLEKYFCSLPMKEREEEHTHTHTTKKKKEKSKRK